MQFIYRLAEECGLSRPETRGWCEGRFEQEPELLTRKEASAAIDALQLMRNQSPPTEGGKDELVSVGMATGPAKKILADDDTDF